MTIEQRLHAGSRAKEILDSEVFAGAFDDIEKDLIEQWKTSPARDHDGREKLWTYLQMLRRVRSQLEQTMATGQLAQLELQHRQTLADRARGLFPAL
ncbi:hypothetical protein UFOVP73_48 [uncultured Caudovirales phage]|uniref:Uncharacterized protein n=1 Tax=uncultured Caudovirales phage TaxID=2100421 RepID=A0A6J5KYX7_9CAUD|nr:hypothetical protein UFOVP73_48 [uncultured Caudovirales phage]CAB5194569.1 hypothetical protein UFOVP170_8 [uncultured Caudovirales phage]